jgi:hypothetical protein
MESRSDDWVMLQKLPANATRPVADYEEGTTWANRVSYVEKRRHGPSLDEVIRMRRTSASLFRDRLTTGRFRQIMSRQAVEEWIRNGHNPDLKDEIVRFGNAMCQ